MYKALRPMKVTDNTGTTRQVQPGELMPDEWWKNPAPMISRGWIERHVETKGSVAKKTAAKPAPTPAPPASEPESEPENKTYNPIELSEMKKTEIKSIAQGLGINTDRMLKPDIIRAIIDAQ